MHARELLSVAAIVADCGGKFIQSALPDSSAGLHQYWSTSRRRLDAWTGAFTGPAAPLGATRLPVVAEVLFSEVLTRVWAAAATAHDIHHKRQMAGPVARSIHLGHQELRNRALLAILKMQTTDSKEARRLNILRQKCERWTDMFVAYFPMHPEVERLAFDPARSKEFAIDLHHENRHREAVQSLTMASVELAMQQAAHTPAANGALNQRIAAAVLGCLPAEVFDASSIGSVLWQSRIESTADDTMGMIAELLALE